MKVTPLDNNLDWTWGRPLLKEDEAIKQSIITRLRSFADDWFLDTSANIPYFDLLGDFNTEAILKNNISTVVRNTEGVLKINSLTLENVNRIAKVSLNIDTIYSKNLTIEGVTIGNN